MYLAIRRLLVTWKKTVSSNTTEGTSSFYCTGQWHYSTFNYKSLDIFPRALGGVRGPGELGVSAQQVLLWDCTGVDRLLVQGN